MKDGSNFACKDQPEEAEQAQHHKDMVIVFVDSISSNPFDILAELTQSSYGHFFLYFLSEEILNPSIPMALRLSGILMGTCFSGLCSFCGFDFHIFFAVMNSL